jgi:hypothetical protein
VLTVERLTPELRRVAKRRRLERIVSRADADSAWRLRRSRTVSPRPNLAVVYSAAHSGTASARGRRFWVGRGTCTRRLNPADPIRWPAFHYQEAHQPESHPLISVSPSEGRRRHGEYCSTDSPFVSMTRRTSVPPVSG